MDRAKLIEGVKSLYNDIDKCISELVIARGKRDEQGIADAHWHMESLMVKAQQMCSVILDSMQEEPVSENLQKVSKEWLTPQLDKSYTNYGEGKMMELTHFDGYAMLDAIEFGANWQKKQDEKDIADMLFVERIRGADDGKRIMKEQMMKDAVIAHVNTYENIGGACYVEFVANISPSKYKKKKKTVKLIIIQED